MISIAVSGNTYTTVKISNFLNLKENQKAKILQSRDGHIFNDLIPWTDYIEHATYDPLLQKIRFEELMDFARDLHDFMRDHAKLTESEKPLIVSGTLIALLNKAFTMSYHVHSPEDLQKEWMRIIREEIQRAEIPRAKKDNMSQPYSSIAVHPELGRATKNYPKGVLHELIKRLNEKVFPFISIYHDFDIVGQFYGEFLKYTGGDKKSLGIVLTPRHITELFALLANVNKNSKVLDICAGTGGFLISAMHKMMKDTSTEEERDNIKKYSLIGVEQQPNMFALAASNMILRGDGKANLYQGSCFDVAITKAIKAHKCDVGMLNPPFSQGDADFHELYFVKHILDCLEKGATGIVITPMSCAISPHPARVELLKNHTLEAVMSMPNDLFSPVEIITCIMVFTAKIPHITSNKKTWFGYWKDDGFVKTKHRGRIDSSERWESIQHRWIEMFRNREIHSGESIMQKVTSDDEWCAEAYMETDYSNLTKDNFVDEVKKYISFKFRINSKQHKENVAFDEWKYFCIGELFEVKKGRRLTKANMTEGNTPFIGAIDSNNGVSVYIGQKPIFEGNTITVNYDGNGVAEAYYQPVPYWALDSVNVLYPKFKLTPAIAMFLIAIIRQEKFRFNYGRKWHMQRMKESMIKLPAKINNEPDWEHMENYIKLLPLGNEI